MLIYLDCEFTDLIGVVSDIKLISAGFVAESGNELYFELPGNYDASECNTFVHEAVLPYLDAAKHGLPAADAAQRLKDWIESFGEPVTLATDAPGYDFALVAELLKDHGIWPSNLTNIPQHVDAGSVQQSIEDYFDYQPIAVRHHALWDARALASARKSVMAVYVAADLLEKPIAERNPGNTDEDLAARQEYLDTITRDIRPK